LSTLADARVLMAGGAVSSGAVAAAAVAAGIASEHHPNCVASRVRGAACSCLFDSIRHEGKEG